MLKTVRHNSTLYYYDGPQVFEARDDSGGYYLAVRVEPLNDLNRYLVAAVFPDQLLMFRNGWLDLRAVLAGTGNQEWYLATTAHGLDWPLIPLPQAKPLADCGHLPDEGFYLRDHCLEETVPNAAGEPKPLAI